MTGTILYSRSKSDEEIFRYRMSPLSMYIRYSFTRIMQSQKGVWRDQLFCHVEDKRFLSICPINDFKYLDKDKIATDMCSLLQTINLTEAIYTACRPLELKSGPIDTFNIIYIGPAAWEGGAVCVPYMYSRRNNDTWVFEHELFDRIADQFNENLIEILRTNFYGVSNISYEQTSRNLTSKGYRIVDTKDVAKKRVGSIIATVGIAEI